VKWEKDEERFTLQLRMHANAVANFPFSLKHSAKGKKKSLHLCQKKADRDSMFARLEITLAHHRGISVSTMLTGNKHKEILAVPKHYQVLPFSSDIVYQFYLGRTVSEHDSFLQLQVSIVILVFPL
jgi:hypothetical protein